MLKKWMLLVLALMLCGCTTPSSKPKLNTNDSTKQAINQAVKYRAVASFNPVKPDLALVYVINPYYLSLPKYSPNSNQMPLQTQLVQTIHNGKKWTINSDKLSSVTVYTNAFHCFYIAPGNYTFSSEIYLAGITGAPINFQPHATLPLNVTANSITFIANRIYYNYQCEESDQCFYTVPSLVSKNVAKNYVGQSIYWLRRYSDRSDKLIPQYPPVNSNVLANYCPVLN